jgi:hypothetical protein
VRALLLGAVLLATGLAGCAGSAEDEKLGAVDAAREVYAEEGEGKDLSSGPCLANPLDDPYENWVVDVVHSPRQAVDDEAVNQCSAYRDGDAKHFVELDEYGHLVRAQ